MTDSDNQDDDRFPIEFTAEDGTKVTITESSWKELMNIDAGGDSSTNSVESERNAEGRSQENTREPEAGQVRQINREDDAVEDGNEPADLSNGKPEPDGVIMRYPAAVSDRWRFHQDIEYGKRTENTERKIVYSLETIQNVIEHRLEEVEEKLEEESGFDRLNRNDLKARKHELQNLSEVFGDG